MCQRFDEVEGATYAQPQGAFYIFPDFSAHYGHTINGKTIRRSLDMIADLLDDVKVGVVPGSVRGLDNHLRLPFAMSLEEINLAWTKLRRRWRDSAIHVSLGAITAISP